MRAMMSSAPRRAFPARLLVVRRSRGRLTRAMKKTGSSFVVPKCLKPKLEEGSRQAAGCIWIDGSCLWCSNSGPRKCRKTRGSVISRDDNSGRNIALAPRSDQAR